MERDALLRVVKATRLAMNLAKDMNGILSLSYLRTPTRADDIFGQLADALFLYCGEHLAPDQDFEKDSKTMSLLTSDLSDGAVAEEFYAMAKGINQQPKPNTFSKSEMEKLYQSYGGYMKSTPEGSWTGGKVK